MVVKKTAVKDSGKASNSNLVNIELGNDCKVYVDKDSTLYRSGIVYQLAPDVAKNLLANRDAKGIRYFYEITHESMVKRKRARDANMARLAAQMAEDEMVGSDHEEEIDTGGMKLEDGEGNPVGRVSV